MTVRVGVTMANVDRVDPVAATEFAVAAEEAGFESIWAVEHTLMYRTYGDEHPGRTGRMHDGFEERALAAPLIWLAFAAARTTRIRLATGVLVLPLHPPALLAKETASLDRLAAGRLILGVGAGWLRAEFDDLGVPYDARGRRVAEYVEVLRHLWRGEPTCYTGESVTLRGGISRPTPGRGTIPIVMGGGVPRVARRAGDLADGFFPVAPIDRLPALIRVARTAAETVRPGVPFDVTAQTSRVPHVARLAAMDVDRVVLAPPPGRSTWRDPGDLARAMAAVRDVADVGR